ncbi:PadR family transcriptional regulator [Sanguibacter sp. HDW7]|uniref:PadR family transcriptional regulator n=1 Tax=Sanguibacter sp. HDW7 TaxID=2714931 RepID=UPI00140CE1BF|nr:PadR family transcriptional regulator [Sanguibacter sp. HDW7]QIK83930.1 PadR family transcriptional regulator [Sanguibacter sp. HDW7]
MSVRHGLMALLAERPMHGYQLRQEFESRTGGTWPLNVGQVYTTLQRLVRDGLVTPAPQGDAGADEAAADDAGTVEYQLTDAGRTEADAWWTTPVRRGAPARDELAIKLALAVTVPGVDVRAVVQLQRTETMRGLHDYTRLRSTTQVDGPAELAFSLVLDNLVFQAEAEMRWLDHVEARLARAAHARRTPPANGATTATPSDTTAAPTRTTDDTPAGGLR